MARGGGLPEACQAALIRLARLSPEHPGLLELLQEAAVLVSQALQVDFCMVLELSPDGERLHLRAGVGWREGLLGEATVAVSTATHAGSALLNGGPLVVEDMTEKGRFVHPAWLEEHGLKSGVSLAIPGAAPFGVLAVHTSKRRNFSNEEVRFLQSAAKLMGEAIQWCRMHDAQRRGEDECRRIIDGAPIGMALLGDGGRFIRANQAACQILGSSEADLRGRSIYELMEGGGELRGLFEKLARGEMKHLRAAARILESRGRSGLVSLTVAVVPGVPLELVATFEDLAEQRRREDDLLLTRFMLDKTRDAIAWNGPDGRITGANEAMCQILGRTREEVLAMTVPEVDVEAPPEGWEEAWRELKARGSLMRDSRFRRKDGRETPVEISVSYLEHNGYEYACAIVRDVSERRRAAAELEGREARYRALFENAAATVMTMDLDENITSVNRTGERVLGYRREELIGMNMAELLPKGQRDLLRVMTGRKLREGGTTTYELELMSWDGRLLPMQITSSLIYENGVGVGSQAIAIDISKQREALEARRQSEERFRALVENGMDLITVLAVDGTVLYVSPSVQRVLGYGPEERLGKNTFDLIHPDDREAVSNVMKEAARTPGAAGTLQFRVRRSDGNWCYLEAAARNLLDNPVVAGIVVNSRDVTERKRSEQALQESRAELAAALASMTDAVFISDTQGTFVEFNDAFAAFHRFRNKEECSRVFRDYPSILDVFLADGTPAPVEMWAVPRALRGQTVTNAEYTLRRKDTGETWVGSYSFGPIRNRLGTIVGSVVVGRDITERKQAEATLRESERVQRKLAEALGTERAKLQAIIDSLPVGLWIADANGRMTLVNDHARAIWGGQALPATDVAGYPAYRAWWAESGKPIEPEDTPMARSLKGETCKGLEVDIQRFDGKRGAHLISSAPIRALDGTVTGCVAVVQDTTERKRVEEALRLSQTELRALAAQLISREEQEHRSMARELHDDFGQRLTALGFDLASVKTALPPDVQDPVRGKLETAQSRLANLSDDLRRLAHQLHPSAVELLGLPAALRELCEATSRQGGFEVRLTTRRFPAAVGANTALCLYRVAQECLRNVLRHARAKSVSVTLFGIEGGLRLSIRDTGVGFDTGATTSLGGLGLISIRERVRLAGGTLEIHSRPGHGTQVVAMAPLGESGRGRES